MATKKKLRVEECRLISVNLAAEGSPENPTSRTDLSYEGLADKQAMAMLIGCEEVDQFWNEKGQIQYLGITNITSRAELEKCTMSFLEKSIADVKVKKISFKPISGRMIEIKLQVQVHHSAEQLVLIDSWQKKVGILTIETAQGDLFDDDGKGGPDPNAGT